MDQNRPDDSLNVSLLVKRHRDGDASAREELIRVTLGRLEGMARRMLGGFPAVKRWEDTMDILQDALIRLDRALRAVAPGSSKEFFGLAAEQLRRTLLDLARHYQGAHGLGKNHQSGIQPGGAASDGGIDPAAPDTDSGDLDRWAALHEAVETLPVAEREVFMLTLYHGWTQAEIGELFQVDERTVRRRWREAVNRLTAALGGELPTA